MKTNSAPDYQYYDANEQMYLTTGSASTQDRTARHKGKKKNPIGFSYQPPKPPPLDSGRDPKGSGPPLPEPPDGRLPKGFEPAPPPGPEHKLPKLIALDFRPVPPPPPSSEYPPDPIVIKTGDKPTR